MTAAKPARLIQPYMPADAKLVIGAVRISAEMMTVVALFFRKPNHTAIREVQAVNRIGKKQQYFFPKITVQNDFGAKNRPKNGKGKHADAGNQQNQGIPAAGKLRAPVPTREESRKAGR